MKKVLLTCCMLFGTLCATAQQLTITVQNITEHTGVIKIGVYDEQNYMKSTVADAEVKANRDEVTATLTLPRAGKYAVAIYQDKNGNNQLDVNFMGIPTEPFGFSNLQRYPMGTPKFKATALEMKQDLKVTIPLFDSPF